LDQVGVGGNRLEMYNMSSAMGKRWAEVCTEMTERIRELGPSPARKGAASGRAGSKGVPAEAEAGHQEPSGCC
jgi:F420-non-reducing hydrogenase iron-sulfur subunit